MGTNSNQYFVGISGGSGSGKTYFITELQKRFDPSQICLISLDNYYRDKSELPRQHDGSINFDHPEAVNLDALLTDIQLLKEGKEIHLKEYTFNNPKIVPKDIVYKPSPIIVIEGLFVFHKKIIADNFNLKIFIDAQEHIKLSRRIVRDYKERGYELEEVLSRYRAHVIPMYNKFVAPHKDFCDIIIPNNAHMDIATQVVLDHLEMRIK